MASHNITIKPTYAPWYLAQEISASEFSDWDASQQYYEKQEAENALGSARKMARSVRETTHLPSLAIEASPFLKAKKYW